MSKVSYKQYKTVAMTEAVVEDYIILLRSNTIGQSWQGPGFFLQDWTLLIQGVKYA